MFSPFTEEDTMSTTTLSPESRAELDALRSEIRDTLSQDDSNWMRNGKGEQVRRWYRPQVTSCTPDEPMGFCPDEDERAVLNDRVADQDVLNWLSRSEDDEMILRRWNPPKRELTQDEKDERAAWEAKQIAFLRAKLHRLLSEFCGAGYGTNVDAAIVTEWQQVNGRWSPKTSVHPVEWVKATVSARGELSGFASCARTIENRIARRRKYRR